jgi:hypothetical protein
MNTQKTPKNIQVGDMLALRHNMQFNADGISWLKDANGDFVADPTSPLEPVWRGFVSYIATYKTITEKAVAKKRYGTVTVLTCADGSTYELNASYAYIVKAGN